LGRTRILFLLLAGSLPAIAGFCTADPLAGDPRHEFQLFAGYSPSSSTLIGTTTDRKFVAAGFEYSYRCWAWKPVSIAFTAGLLPAAILLQPAEYSSRNSAATAPGHAVYGFGITPLGFTFDFGRTHAIYPFFEINGGIIVSTEPIPLNLTGATALNFLVDFGGGVKWRPRGRRYGFEAGYKLLHISNAFTTAVNPGVDNNVFYMGVSVYR
jgi:hypothetical protein